MSQPLGPDDSRGNCCWKQLKPCWCSHATVVSVSMITGAERVFKRMPYVCTAAAQHHEQAELGISAAWWHTCWLWQFRQQGRRRRLRRCSRCQMFVAAACQLPAGARVHEMRAGAANYEGIGCCKRGEHGGGVGCRVGKHVLNHAHARVCNVCKWVQ